MQVGSQTITWMHPSYFNSAIEMNKKSGMMAQDMAWFKKLYIKPNVFSMAVLNKADKLLGWCTYRKTSSGIEILWMMVPSENTGNGIGSSMIERLKGWMHSVPNRRGALTCNVHEYADDMLYFLRKHGFECLKINPQSKSYRMCFIRGPRCQEI